MRIALVHPFHWSEVRRGGERYLGDLAWYLVGAGHRVDVLTTYPDAALTWVEEGVTVRASRRIEPPVLKRRGLDALTTHAASVLPGLMRRRYDLVHALTPWGALAGAGARQRVVYTEIGHPTEATMAAMPAGRHRAYRAAVRTAGLVTALSESAAAGVAAATGVVPVVQPPGVRTEVFGADRVAHDHPPTVLFASDAAGWSKGADTLLAAMDDLARRRPEVRLQFGGPGDHRWALDRLGLPDDAPVRSRIDVLGVGDPADLPARYARASVTVLPSIHEAFGLVLVESLAAGTPVVCTDAGGMRDIVTDDAIGRTFPAGDHVALSRAIEATLSLASDPATARRCRAHAARWSWADVIGPAHVALYESLLGGLERT